MIGIYCWITVNAILSQFYEISGHIIVIFVGIPIVCILVKSTRESRIEALMTSTTEKMKNDIDSLNQITIIQEWLRESGKNQDMDREMRIKGLINLHIFECQNQECICKNLDELYDYQNDKYLSSAAMIDLHKNQVFVNHFNKQLYSEALNKFINSPSIHISYAFYQFSAMRNIHAAFHELKIAAKKRPTIQQRFTIFRYQHIIELFIKKESDKMKHIYEQLTNVKEFEGLFQDMQKQIEKVCNFQVEFWTHLTTVVPDLNYLNDLNNKIFNAATEADKLWKSLCIINCNYPQALNLYGEYLTFIRNNQQAGKEYFDKAHNVDFAQKSIQDNVKRSDILFTEDSTVVHISGNKESSGRILKVSQGLYKCFGLSKQEIIGHNVNTLMPTIFSEKHQDYLETYYRTGRQNIFNKERQLFAMNRQGYCFTMKILIKQMPNLKEDIQYVGMIKPISTDYEYIITDMQGNIDSFTSGVGSLLNLNPQHFKESGHINIQIIAPELISIFEYKRLPPGRENNDHRDDGANYRNYYRRPSFNTFQFGQSRFLSNNKYSVPGGDQLTFIVPGNFIQLLKSEKPTKSNRTTASNKKKGGQIAPDESSISHGGPIPQNQGNKYAKSSQFREFLKYLSKTYAKRPPDMKKLLSCKEYKEFDIKKTVSIEIREWGIPLGNNEDKGLKLLLFMINKNQSEKKDGQQELQSFEGANAQQQAQQQQDFGQAIKSQVNNNANFEAQKLGKVQRIGSNNIHQYLQDKEKQNKNNPMQQQFQSAGLTSKLLSAKITYSQDKGDQLTQAMSFLDLENPAPQINTSQQNVQQTDPLTPIYEESFAQESPDPRAKGGLQKNKFNSSPNSKKNQFSDNQQDKKNNNTGSELMMDLRFERQETDEQEEDNEEEIDTDRIDVKKEIVLNDEIKQNTKSFEDPNNPYQSADSIPKTDSKPQLRNNNSSSTNKMQFQSNTQKSEDSKNQMINKPLSEKISQSRDDDEDIDKNPNDGVDSDNDDEEGEEGDDEGGEDWEDGDDDDDEFDEDENILGDGDSHGNQEPLKSHGDNDSEEERLIQKVQGDDSKRYRDTGGSSPKRGARFKSGANTPKGQSSLVLGKGPSVQNGWSSDDPNYQDGNQQNQAQNAGQEMQKKQKMRDYSRIVTNIRYKCFDDETCGSAYFNDFNCSEHELDIREMIKKNETTKKRREKRRRQKKEEEEKKQNDRDGQSIQQTGVDKEEGKATVKEDKKEDEKSANEKVRRIGGNEIKKRKKEDESSKSRSRGRSESSGNSDEDKKNEDDEEIEEQRLPERDVEQLNDEGEVSSIASSQQSQARTFFSLRAAIDEKFIPLQIKNLRFVANIVWILILLLAIVYYVIQFTLFTDIQEYIEIIINSEKRVNDIMNMNLKLNDIILLNEGYLDPQNYPYSTKQQTIQTFVQDFLNSTTELKNSQTHLSLQTSGLSEGSRKRINPEDVVLQYERVTDLPNTYSYNIWEAIIQIVVQAYKLAETPLEIVHSNPSVQFILQNCMNSVMSALQESTNAIIDESDSAREKNINVFMYLLIAVSCSLILSMGFLLPVIRKAKYNKQEVFELFTHRKVEKCIDDQLKKCRWFITKYQAQAENQNFEAELQDNLIEENTHIPEKEMKADDDKSTEYIKNYKKQKKKWKRININFGMLLSKFSCFLLLIESFFLFNYFISKQFLSEVSLLTKELRLLISRQPNLSNIILMEKELFYSNNTAQFLFRPVKDVLDQAYQTQYQDYQDLLTSFTLNYDYHTDKYNTDFNNIIYSNLCDQLTFYIPYITSDGSQQLQEIKLSDCNSFNGGILQKGVYNSVVKYWTQLQQLHNDFFGSGRQTADIKVFLNHQKLITSELMSERYFETSHWHLVEILKEDIDNFFTDEFKIYQAVFIIFLIYLLLIYFFVWKIFMKNLMEELWKAKAVLSVLPVEVCFRIEEIRSFIYKNSSSFMGASS